MLLSHMATILLDRSHQSSLMHCSDSPGSTIARYIVRLKLQKAAYVVEGPGNEPVIVKGQKRKKIMIPWWRGQRETRNKTVDGCIAHFVDI